MPNRVYIFFIKPHIALELSLAVNPTPAVKYLIVHKERLEEAEVYIWGEHAYEQKKSSKNQNTPGKLGHQSAISWNSLGLFRDYGMNYISFRNKTFFYFSR